MFQWSSGAVFEDNGSVQEGEGVLETADEASRPHAAARMDVHVIKAVQHGGQSKGQELKGRHRCGCGNS